MARDWYDLFLTVDGAAAPTAAVAEEERGEERQGFFRRLRSNMRKTREALQAEVQATLFQGDLDEETWERLEEALIYADVGASTTAAGRRPARAGGRGGRARRRRGAVAAGWPSCSPTSPAPATTTSTCAPTRR